jgi:hypothetical protein
MSIIPVRAGHPKNPFGVAYEVLTDGATEIITKFPEAVFTSIAFRGNIRFERGVAPTDRAWSRFHKNAWSIHKNHINTKDPNYSLEVDGESFMMETVVSEINEVVNNLWRGNEKELFKVARYNYFEFYKKQLEDLGETTKVSGWINHRCKFLRNGAIL